MTAASKGARTGPAVADQADVGLVRQAMAYRVKYRLDGSKRKRMVLSLLGVHPRNRGGVYPSPETVQNLGLKLLKTGFNVDEANHEGACVQEIPAEERSCDPWDSSNPYTTFKEFNRKHCGSATLQACFSGDSDTLYGTLSHSHLLLCLLAMKNGAEWEWPDEWRPIFDLGGSRQDGPDITAVKAVDAGLAALLHDGLRMEVLSWKMQEEEPLACSLISQALNSGHQLALQISELTALAVLTGRVTLELESAVAGRVSFETVKAKVRHELDMYVDQSEFLDLFEFVVNMGATKATS